MQTIAAIAAIAAVASAQCVQVITQISDGQVQGPMTYTSCPATSTVMSTVNMPTTYNVMSTSMAPATSCVMVPVTYTTVEAAHITQIGDGQVQGPTGYTTVVGTTSSESCMTTSTPVVYTTQVTSTVPVTHTVVISTTPVAPTMGTMTASGSVCVAPITQIGDGQVQGPTTMSCTPVAPASATVTPYTGAAAPTQVAGALGALVLGAAALVLA